MPEKQRPLTSFECQTPVPKNHHLWGFSLHSQMIPYPTHTQTHTHTWFWFVYCLNQFKLGFYHLQTQVPIDTIWIFFYYYFLPSLSYLPEPPLAPGVLFNTAICALTILSLCTDKANHVHIPLNMPTISVTALPEGLLPLTLKVLCNLPHGPTQDLLSSSSCSNTTCIFSHRKINPMHPSV